MSELLVIAFVAGKRCAFYASDVASVIETGSIAPVPRAPDHVVGITALRSQAMTVIDCRTAIGEDATKYPRDTQMVVVQIEGHSYALCADKIDDIAVTQSEVSTIAGGSGDQWDRVCHGMLETDRGPVMLFDIEKLIMGLEEKPGKAA